ncbi:MAG: hypothetical protein LBJ59_07575 [Zoogloeaceae bacterium]|jgi:hypothetical protein|nr:hypothetical protein [Zoogloeaceae bacterium]
MVWCVNSYHDLGGGNFTGAVHDERQAISANCEYVLVTPQEYFSALNGSDTSSDDDPVLFDSAVGGQIFGLFFSITVGLYIFSKCIGLVIKAVKEF